jgi:coenzyme F420-reducing hydrogenase beta subunit
MSANDFGKKRIEVLAAQNQNIAERLDSSSGGIFPLIAKKILNDGGVVYGAAFAKDFSIEHIRITETPDIRKLQGSKYAFGKLNSAYKDCKADLENGKKVLFTGTPCQVAGLRAYLKADYPNLYVVDFICHGTPALNTWMQYLEEIANGRKVSEVYFRDKREGWDEYHVTVKFSDGSEYSVNHNNDLYIQGFIGETTLRKSCYQCKFKGIDNRQSDITLGDLWGAKDLAPDLYDDKGTSLLIISSEKGRKIMDAIQTDIVTENIDVDKAFEINWAAIRSARPSVYQPLFEKIMRKGKNAYDILKRLYAPSLTQKVENKLYRKMHGGK